MTTETLHASENGYRLAPMPRRRWWLAATPTLLLLVLLYFVLSDPTTDFFERVYWTVACIGFPAIVFYANWRRQKGLINSHRNHVLRVLQSAITSIESDCEQRIPFTAVTRLERRPHGPGESLALHLSGGEVHVLQDYESMDALIDEVESAYSAFSPPSTESTQRVYDYIVPSRRSTIVRCGLVGSFWIVLGLIAGQIAGDPAPPIWFSLLVATAVAALFIWGSLSTSRKTMIARASSRVVLDDDALIFQHGSREMSIPYSAIRKVRIANFFGRIRYVAITTQQKQRARVEKLIQLQGFAEALRSRLRDDVFR